MKSYQYLCYAFLSGVFNTISFSRLGVIKAFSYAILNASAMTFGCVKPTYYYVHIM